MGKTERGKERGKEKGGEKGKGRGHVDMIGQLNRYLSVDNGVQPPLLLGIGLAGVDLLVFLDPQLAQVAGDCEWRVLHVAVAPPQRTEACQVARTKDLLHVTLFAVGSLRAKSHGVLVTGRDLGLRVDVQVLALRSLGAVAVLGVENTLGHLAEVVLVEVLALVVLFAQAAQPVLADDLVVEYGQDMLLGTGEAARAGVGAIAGVVELADGAVGVEGEGVLLPEEGLELEGVEGGVQVDGGHECVGMVICVCV